MTPDKENVMEQIFHALGQGKNIFLIGEYGSGKTVMSMEIIRTILEHQEVYSYSPLWFKFCDRTMNLTDANIDNMAEEFLKNGLKQYESFPNDLTMRAQNINNT